MISFTEAPAASIIFLLTIGLSVYALSFNQKIFNKWVLHPYSIVKYNRWHTVITSGFIHANWPHLIFNMLSFFFFGFYLEAVLRYYSGSDMGGSIYFAVIYFTSMILSDLTTILRFKENRNFSSLGASGAVSGILFSFILFNPNQLIGAFFIPPIIPAWVFALLYLAYSYVQGKKMKDSINHDAHLWGAVTGIIITVILIPESIKIFSNRLF